MKIEEDVKKKEWSIIKKAIENVCVCEIFFRSHPTRLTFNVHFVFKNILKSFERQNRQDFTLVVQVHL
jgi:hypothetical protein